LRAPGGVYTGERGLAGVGGFRRTAGLGCEGACSAVRLDPVAAAALPGAGNNLGNVSVGSDGADGACEGGGRPGGAVVVAGQQGLARYDVAWLERGGVTAFLDEGGLRGRVGWRWGCPEALPEAWR